jgi:hypothetical protein
LVQASQFPRLDKTHWISFVVVVLPQLPAMLTKRRLTEIGAGFSRANPAR